MSYPIFIINLAQNTERRDFITQQFSQIPELNYQFFEAINGKENPNHFLFQHHNAEKRYKYKGDTMSLGQLGCWGSHYLLWQKCVELNQPIIVLEDDAILLKNFSKTVAFLNSEKNNFEFLWLCESFKSSREKLIQHYSDYTLNINRYFKGWSNTAAYYLTPKAAKKFLDHSQEWIFNVDISMDRYWENGVLCYGVSPFCVQQQREFESDVPQNKDKRKRSLNIKIRREFYKLIDRIQCFWFNLIN